MRKIIINENQRGLLFKNGRYIKHLCAGKYYAHGGKEIEVLDLSQPVLSQAADIETLLADPVLAAELSVVEVLDNEIALHFVNGILRSALRHGKHAFFHIHDRHEFLKVDIQNPEPDEAIPTHVLAKLPSTVCTRIVVEPYQVGRLYFDQHFVRLLASGTYYFWKNDVKVEVTYADTRLTGMSIHGQEILTRDKVTLRINFVCNYRITDFVRIVTEVDDYEEQMHICAQLALREYVEKYTLDELLEKKEELSRYVFSRMAERAKGLYVEIVDANIRDIILPGEIREIMNTVLVAEKRAQANVITRREEVASTRSLLNTARLMEENKTLYKLKELEYIERICENVGNLSISAGGDLLSQLTGILQRDGAV